MNLIGKKLLMMGGTAYYEHIRKYSMEAGFKIVAVGNNPEASYYVGADEAYPYSTTDVRNIVRIVNERGIDGIFVGAQELNILPAISVAEQTGVFFYANRKQWEILSDKGMFKRLCKKCGVPVVPEYSVDTEEDINSLPYPVVIKPVDGSCGHGMNVCYSREDFHRLFEEALKWSQKKEIIVEKLITDADEVFFHYTIQNGKCSLTSAYTKVLTISRNKSRILPIFHMYPSNHLGDYFKTIHQGIMKLCAEMNIQNGVMTIQSFYKGGAFYVFEAGYRMGGAQNYVFSEYQNGTNSLEYMVNYALTGNMCDDDIAIRDNPFFRYPCCNYYIGLNPGIIGAMPVANDVLKLPGVINVTVMRKEGDVIKDTNSLDRIGLRLHVVGKTKEDLSNNLVHICNSIKISSVEGKDMVMERLSYSRCISAIDKSVSLNADKQ